MSKHIMVVEDDSSLREWVEFELSMEGYDVSQAADGLLALTNLHAMQQLPDVLLLDVQLPGMDGFTLCKTLQQVPATASIPIIFLTARTTTDDKLTGFASGGVDYLTKPFKMVELKARLKALLRQQDMGREQGRQIEYQRQEKEMVEAAFIQNTLMSCAISEAPGIELAARCRPARSVGGDLYDVHQRPDDCVTIVEADVSGKGLPAALIMTSVRTVLRDGANMLSSPGMVLQQANLRLYNDLTEIGKLVTVFAAFYRPEKRTVTYANAGHAVAVYRPAGGVPRIIDATGLPFGILDNTDYPELVLRMQPDDLLVICSDGFSEAGNLAEEFFGFERLLAVIDEYAHLGATAILEGVSERVALFAGGFEQTDDQTIIVVKGKE